MADIAKLQGSAIGGLAKALGVSVSGLASIMGLTIPTGGGGFQGSNYGYTSGGYVASAVNVIDKFSFAADGNATDVGDLTIARYSVSGQSSTVSGYTSGGGSASNVIDKFSFSTDGNATDIGDLTVGRSDVASQQY